jgi:putative ABC transport system ATP-binding protein
MAALVQIEHLVKSYWRGGQQVPVLTDISLSIEQGDFTALMGPSGSGKSTLLNLIAGIDQPDSGSLLVGGLDITRLSESELAAWRARNVGFIFQFYNLMPVLTAYENVELPLMLSNLSRRERRERVEMTLAMVNLQDRMDHTPNELSGGQQQRVAIARAIVTDPSLIVADEPTGDLDRQSATEVLALLNRLNRELGKTIIMVTHDAHAAAQARSTVQLDKGELSAAVQSAGSAGSAATPAAPAPDAVPAPAFTSTASAATASSPEPG